MSSSLLSSSIVSSSSGKIVANCGKIVSTRLISTRSAGVIFRLASGENPNHAGSLVLGKTRKGRPPRGAEGRAEGSELQLEKRVRTPLSVADDAGKKKWDDALGATAAKGSAPREGSGRQGLRICSYTTHPLFPPPQLRLFECA